MAAAILAVCVGPAEPQTSGAARVVALMGQVSVLRDNAPWVLNVGDSVQPRQIIITGADGFARFELADGSSFEIFPNSKTVFRDNPGDWRDLLDVFIGRVKVHIQKLAGGLPNHNKVRTPTALISVRGTIFDVAVEDEDDTTLVSVEEGQVAVRHLIQPGEKILNQGEWVRVYKNQPLTAKSVDHGAVLQRTLRAAADALYEVLYRTQRAPGGGPSAPGSADKNKPAPPGPPPAGTNTGGGTPPGPPPPPPGN